MGRRRDKVWRRVRGWFRPAAPEKPDTASSRSEVETPSVLAFAQGMEGESPTHRGHTFDPGGFQNFDDFHDVHEDAVSEDELLEFLAGDLDLVAVDPVFRERLREELWEMVLDEGIARPKGS